MPPEEPIRLFFDECVGKPMIDRLIDFFCDDRDAPRISSIFAEDWVGKSDAEWFPRILTEGWIPVSVDRGRKPSRGPALPDLCEDAGITHILGSSAFHQRQQPEKVQLFAGVWPALRTTLRECSAGTRVMIHLTPKHAPTLKLLTPPFKRPRREDRQR